MEQVQMEEGEATLTTDHKKLIESIITMHMQIDLKKEEVKDVEKALAAKLGIKPAVLTRRINLYRKALEDEKVCKDRIADLDFVEKLNAI